MYLVRLKLVFFLGYAIAFPAFLFRRAPNPIKGNYYALRTGSVLLPRGQCFSCYNKDEGPEHRDDDKTICPSDHGSTTSPEGKNEAFKQYGPNWVFEGAGDTSGQASDSLANSDVHFPVDPEWGVDSEASQVNGSETSVTSPYTGTCVAQGTSCNPLDRESCGHHTAPGSANHCPYCEESLIAQVGRLIGGSGGKCGPPT